MDCSLPGSFVHGILQARILEWVAMPSLQGIFLTQGWNSRLLCLLHWQVGSLPLSPQGSHSECSQLICLSLFLFSDEQWNSTPPSLWIVGTHSVNTHILPRDWTPWQGLCTQLPFSKGPQKGRPLRKTFVKSIYLFIFGSVGFSLLCGLVSRYGAHGLSCPVACGILPGQG